MSDPDRITVSPTALARFGLGARFDLSESEQKSIAGDPRGFVKSELDASRALLAAPGLQDTAANLVASFEAEQQRKMAREAQTVSMPMDQMQQMQPGAAMPSPAPKEKQVEEQIYQTEAQARFGKAITERSGIVERLVWFWSNHFCVSAAKGNPDKATCGSFEREAIRPYVLGSFVDMLRAVEQHPAMLYFLDNRDSIGPNSKAGQKRGKGLNENLAREIMELHTLGVDGGYTQADVTSFANVITGWSYPGLNSNNALPGVFTFNANAHEPGPQRVLGRTYNQSGIDQGEAVLADLAVNEATAHHIAFKLTRHFVSDDPPPALVNHLAKTFLDTHGDLKAVTAALVDSDASWAISLSKFRTPQEYLAASSRALNFPVEDPQPLLRALNQLGQPLWRPAGPNGFGDRMQDWASPEGMKVRLALAGQMAKQSPLDGNPADYIETVLGPDVSTDTRLAITRAESRAQAFTLLVMSPEFQYR